VVCLLSGCAKREQVSQEGKIISIQLPESHDYKHELKLSDIAEDVSYIPLETTSECLIGEDIFDCPKFTKEYIFINFRWVIFQFDKQGKFIRKINKIGQGPTECRAIKFVLCEKKEFIYIFSDRDLSVNIFDFSGKHIKTIKNPFEEETGLIPAYITCDKEGNIYYSFRNCYGDMKNKYVVMNDEGEILHESPNYITCNIGKPIMQIAPSFYPFHETEGIYYYNDDYNDTIFRINKDYTASAAYIVKTPNRLSLEDVLKLEAMDIQQSSLSNKNMLNGVTEDEKYLYLYHGFNGYAADIYNTLLLSRYDKQTNQLMENINPNIKNDWDGGKDMKIQSSYPDNDKVYNMLQPFEMKEMLAAGSGEKEVKYPEKQKALKMLVDSLEEDANPFIMIVKLK
jgi:hypothetical protein